MITLTTVFTNSISPTISHWSYILNMTKSSISGKLTALAIFTSMVLTGCGMQSAPEPRVDLDRVMSIAGETMNSFDARATGVNEANAMNEFSVLLGYDLNDAQPPLYDGQIGVAAQEDGSLMGFNDADGSSTREDGEQELFKVEVDTENNRLLASSEGAVQEGGFSMGGLFMGMMLGNMLSRQRTAGVNPATRKATPASSARSRAGSGSHSVGK